jgi:hypothetical protein
MDKTFATATASPSTNSESGVPSAGALPGKAQNQQESISARQSAESTPVPSGTSAGSAPSSAFEKSTVEIVLQFLPHDGHAEGRRIRNALIVNGKTLRVGSLRVSALPALLASWALLNPDQIVARLAQYVNQCQQQVSAVQRLLSQKTARSSTGSVASTAPSAQLPLKNAASPSAAQTTPIAAVAPPPEQKESDAKPREQELSVPAIAEETPLQQLSLFS